MENNWQLLSEEVFLATEPIEIMHSDGCIWVNSSSDFTAYRDWYASNRKAAKGIVPTHYRCINTKESQSLDDALGDNRWVRAFQYPQTTFKPSSEAELKAAEAARVNALLSEKLSTIACNVSKLTRKNFSVADIKLVKDLLESVEEYEENK